ncbi:MAG: hypothetical protein WDM81_04895 [Rhizomicrobium sp.]
MLHTAAFGLPEGFALSTGIGVSVPRILLVPVLGGLLLGLAALIVSRYRKAEIVDPIEANALHGGRMSMLDSLRLVLATIVSNAAGASVGMEAGYSQFGASTFAAWDSGCGCAVPTSALSLPPARAPPSPRRSTRRWPRVLCV